MILCFVRQGFREQDLAVRFLVSQSTVRRIHSLFSWANYLHFVFGIVPIWPSKKLIKQPMPECFAMFPNT